MHLNRAVVIGRVTSAGPKRPYDARATPTCTFRLDVEESGKEGQTRHSSIPIEIGGKLAESTAEPLEAGQDVCVERRPAYRKATSKDGKEKAGLVVVSWYVTHARPMPARVESANEECRRMIDVSVGDGTSIITLPTSVLVLTQAECIHALRQGLWWHRRQALAPRQATRHGGAPNWSGHG